MGVPKLTKGVAKDRRISIEDPDMRHGRKSRSQKIDGYKRHILKDLDIGVIRAVAVTRANTPEAAATVDLEVDLKRQQVQLNELHIDRAYLSSHWVKERSEQLQIFCKAWPVRNSGQFDKNAFVFDWENQVISCPNQVIMPFEPGKVVHFPKPECAACPLRERCTTSKNGRSISIHPDEGLMQELRRRQSTSKRSRTTEGENLCRTLSRSCRTVAGANVSVILDSAKTSSTSGEWLSSIIFMSLLE